MTLRVQRIQRTIIPATLTRLNKKSQCISVWRASKKLQKKKERANTSKVDTEAYRRLDQARGKDQVPAKDAITVIRSRHAEQRNTPRSTNDTVRGKAERELKVDAPHKSFFVWRSFENSGVNA